MSTIDFNCNLWIECLFYDWIHDSLLIPTRGNLLSTFVFHLIFQYWKLIFTNLKKKNIFFFTSFIEVQSVIFSNSSVASSYYGCFSIKSNIRWPFLSEPAHFLYRKKANIIITRNCEKKTMKLFPSNLTHFLFSCRKNKKYLKDWSHFKKPHFFLAGFQCHAQSRYQNRLYVETRWNILDPHCGSTLPILLRNF